jgi:hypothetical protein
MKRITLIIIYIAILNCSCSNKLKDIRKKFGTEQNNVRQRLHLVSVDPTFELKEDITVENRRYIFVNKKETELTTPNYLRKIILLDTSKQIISFEEDHFMNPIEKKYLIISHDYKTNLTTIELQNISGNPSNSESKYVDIIQADSILKSWKISLNPF